MIKNIYTISILRFIILSLFIFPIITSASTVDGTIQIPNQYAWGENVGWVNFAALHGDVHVTDSGLTGYIWDSIYGWINLNPTTSGVKNDSHGNLSGFAWSAGTGFIDFNGVTIDSSGVFHGQAQGTLFGRLNFDCLSCSVITDYRPGASLQPPQPTMTGGGFFDHGYTIGIVIPPVTPEKIVLPPSVIKEIISQEKTAVTTPPVVVKKEPAPTDFSLLLANFPTFKDILTKLNINVSQENQALKKLTGVEFTLPSFLSNSLAFVNILGLHIPSLSTTFKNSLSIQVPSTGQSLLHPELGTQVPKEGQGISQTGLGVKVPVSGKPLQTGLSANDIRNFKNLSLIDLPIEIKKGVPEEVLFTRAGNANIDIPINLKIDKSGKLNKSIELTSNKRITLIIKPRQDKKVDAVIGYLVFRNKFSLNKTTPISVNENIISKLIPTAYAEGISNLPKVIPEAQVEDMMVLMKFKFDDTNNDGLYVANINTPYIEGNYEIVTSIDYRGEKTPKVLRLTTVIDPEGYVYESAGQNETRIRNATVTMLKLNEITNKYENWNAKDFAQKNPQITNQTGQYSYLVPEGTYQLKVEAKGYETYYSKQFTASEGDSLHENIELKAKRFRFSDYWILFLPLFFW